MGQFIQVNYETKEWESRPIGYTVESDGCWIWTGFVDSKGYGRWAAHGEERAHRASYVAMRGPIPEGTEIDHLCRVRRCINPTHMEAVPHSINVMRGESFSAHHSRKTHCTRGHLFDSDNTYRWANGKRKMRVCRTCRRERDRGYRRGKTSATIRP